MCGIRLISASELVRSSVTLHLEAKFAVLEFTAEGECRACCGEKELVCKCSKCENLFCGPCVDFIKEDMRFCVGCSNS